MRLRVEQARDRVELLRLALLRAIPEEMDAALPGLEEAIQCLQEVEWELRAGTHAAYEVRRELKLLKNDLRLIARLIEHGAAFCRGWASMLGAGPSYTQDGHAVPEAIAAPGGALSLQG
jgi:hypothetical protein